MISNNTVSSILICSSIFLLGFTLNFIWVKFDLCGCLSNIYSKLIVSSSPICNNFLVNLLIAIPSCSTPCDPNISKIFPLAFTYNLF